jgi:hypothetical protein
VAGGEIVWNAELPLHRIEVSGFQDVGAKAGLPQVLHPTRTAAAIRVQMDGDDVFFRGNDRSGLQQGNNSRDNHGSPRQPRIEIGHDGPPQLGTIGRLNG